ncbi:hypothetical protein HOA55_05485 [archaeon]|jgi:hypothetical protein|nr:hypothetical protein [archaeon]MBT3577773.1 hypothetical protein [archaeon]MBT6820780.1 hypothetical protein [archaeon]MBT6956038.1 hypothetical protein [archaeon]MBT7025920.1 hypothetical protein [archaeon]
MDVWSKRPGVWRKDNGKSEMKKARKIIADHNGEYQSAKVEKNIGVATDHFDEIYEQTFSAFHNLRALERENPEDREISATAKSLKTTAREKFKKHYRFLTALQLRRHG